MCGITGIWYLDDTPVKRKEAERFTAAIRHRGPDGQGCYIDPHGSLALGNARLAIVDPQARGNQPLAYGNQRFWITYNGEIYNYRPIRDELRQHGYTFVTDTDTEVILAAYLHWGADCQFKFNGMWAFAIWDSEKQRLFLARDRFGVKPLYTYYDGQRFAFASEVKAFLALDWLDPTPDFDYVTRSLATTHYQQAAEATLLKTVKRLRAGYSLVLQKHSAPQYRRWWYTLDHLATVPQTFDQQAAAFRALFDDACRIRLRKDGPVAVSLSGGMDSTAVLATLHQVGGYHKPQQTRPNSLRAYVATFQDRIRDERRYAELLVETLHIPTSYEKVSTRLTIEKFDQILYHVEDANAFHFANWLIYAAMRRDGITVALTGDGSDELFVAYPQHLQAALAEAIQFGPSLPRYQDLRRIQQAMMPEVYAMTRQGVWEQVSELVASHQYINQPTSAPPLVGAEWLLRRPTTLDFADFAQDRQAFPRQRLLAQQLYFDFHYGILPWILHIKDMISMAHGVEMRSPFMDWRIVCFAFALPSSSLIGNGFAKRLLREAMPGRLPKAIRTRSSKTAFVDSETTLFWQMKPLVLETIQSEPFLQSPIWNGPQLRRAIELAYQTGEADYAPFFWKCVKTARLLKVFAKKNR